MVKVYDAVIVGAGSLGSSLAYHLSARGVSVCVVEQFEVASQTSPRAAGLSTTVSRDDGHAPLAQRSAAMIANMETEIGYRVKFVRSGTIRLTRDKSLVDNIIEEVAQGCKQGISVRRLEKTEATALAPFLQVEPALALTYAPDELYLPDPGEIAKAYMRAAIDNGTVVEVGHRVDGIAFSGERVTGVNVQGRLIAAGCTILCANAGNGRLTAMLGCRLPTVPMRHQLCITEPLSNVEPDHPQVKVVDGRLYVRPHGNCLLVGGFEPDPLIFSHDEADATDTRQMQFDPEPLRTLISGVVDVLPALGSAAFREVRGGIVSMTADGRYILDRIPGFSNTWVVGGDNAGANTTSPMIGKTMAEWIVDGTPSIDLSQFAISRLLQSHQEEVRQAVRQYVNMIALD